MIYYIANARMPTEKAHGIQIAQMLEAFGDLGHEVELIIPQRLNFIKQDIFEYYAIKKNFKIKKLFCLDLVKFGKIGFFIESVSFLISAKIYLISKKPDIIYSRDFLTGLFFKNIVLEIHSLPKKMSFVHKKVYNKAKSIIVLTSFIKNKLKEENISEDKILVSPDAVDFEKFKNAKKIDLPKDKKIVMYAGSFQKWKGANVLLEVAHNFQFPISNFKNVLFVFVGGTKEELKRFKFQALGFKNIKFVGHRPHKEISNWLKSADVLVLPNSGKEKISEFYTSPMKLFEYMASGVPIVASDLPSIKEVLNENNSVLVESDSAESLANGIKTVLQNQVLSAKISKQAYQDAQNYTWKKRAQRILKFIKSYDISYHSSI